MSAPLICLSEFVSYDPVSDFPFPPPLSLFLNLGLIFHSCQGLDLRVEHAHCFSSHGEGGHYHYDVTPEEVEYHGYYVIAEELWRIDQPTNTHQLGRD